MVYYIILQKLDSGISSLFRLRNNVDQMISGCYNKKPLTHVRKPAAIKMFKCVIPMYGLPREITALREAEVELNEGASMAEVIAALKEKVPALEGTVIRKGEDRLAEQYKFNLNGRFYFDGQDFKLHEGDRIALLVPMTGG
jgi:molybdopterin converting factor small subunit